MHSDWHLTSGDLIAADGTLYSGCDTGVIDAWSGIDGSHLRSYVGHKNRVQGLAVGPDGTVYSCGSNIIRVWPADANEEVHVLPINGVDGVRVSRHYSSITALARGPTGKLYSGHSDGKVYEW